MADLGSMELAVQAAKDIRQLNKRLSGYGSIGSDDPHKIISDIADIFDNFQKKMTRDGIVPTTRYLLSVPLLDGQAATSSPEVPDTKTIQSAVNYLMWMGDARAFPALNRIQSLHRVIRVAAPNDNWDTTPNNEERELVTRAIKMIHAIQDQGYRTCEECFGEGYTYCTACGGSGKRHWIETKKEWFKTKEIEHTEVCLGCQGHGKFVCRECGGLGKFLPTI